MEKRVPHCDLSKVHRLIAEGKVRTTDAANKTAIQLGFNFDEMVEVVLCLTMKEFYKSMTTYAAHRVWAGCVPSKHKGWCAMYLKLTVVSDVLIVSFKEL